MALSAHNVDLLNTLNDGVDSQFLRAFFKISKYRVEKALRNVRPISYSASGEPLFDLRDAYVHLCNVRDVLQNTDIEITIDDLPDKLHEGFWNAKLKKLTYEERASTLWNADLVRNLFSKFFQNVRARLQIVPDELDRMLNLGNSQVRNVTALIDDIQNEIYNSNVKTVMDNDFQNVLDSENADADDQEDEEFSIKI